MGAHAERMKLYERGVTKASIDAFNRGWARKLVDILKEQIDMLSVNDTSKLKNSIDYALHDADTIEHKFLIYGLYVSAGVGKGFEHGNGGDLLFMNDKYREVNGYGYKQVGAGLSEHAMFAPKFEHITVKRGKNAGKQAALVRGKRKKRIGLCESTITSCRDLTRNRHLCMVKHTKDLYLLFCKVYSVR